MAAVDVIAQRVRTKWSKRSRGSPGAAIRNAVATSFPLPSGQPPLFHDITVNDDDAFTHVRACSERLRHPHTFGLRLVRDTLLVQVPNGFGVPVRAHRPTAIEALSGRGSF